MSLHFSPDGSVRPCCVSTTPLGTIGKARLPAIWHGRNRRDLVYQQSQPGVPNGCGACASQVATEGRSGSYPELFNARGSVDPEGETTHWPTWMEFNLSNACNLQCLQCDGSASSAIRAQRERRPPLPKVYDDQFFDDLHEFLPHLHGAQFAGGEPFLASENFRVWQMMADLGSTATCIAVTNGTQWNDRVEQVLSQLRMGFTLSVDGITRRTFESVRIGADFTLVMNNFERMIAHAESAGTPVSINYCLMVQNYHEFPELLVWAERRGLPVNVSVVRGPARCAIGRLPADEITRVHRWLSAQDDWVSPILRLNSSVWATEVERIRSWAVADSDELHSMWEMSRYGDVLDLPASGSPNHDAADATIHLERLATDGCVHWLAVGHDDIVHELSPRIDDLLGVDSEYLHGAHVEALLAVVHDRFGEPNDRSEVGLGPDRVDTSMTFDHGSLHASVVALRDARGRAVDGRILMAFEQGHQQVG